MNWQAGKVITISRQPIDFALQGRVGCFKIGKHQRVRYFDLISEQGRYRFKVPHSLHRHCNLQLREGDEVRVSGSVLIDARKRRMKLKLQGLQHLGEGSECREGLNVVTSVDMLQRLDPRTKATYEGKCTSPSQTILVCKSSSCWKQGGREIYQCLVDSATTLGSEANIRVETTGCLGRCKSAPNVKLMPEKITRRSVQPADVPELLQELVAS